MNRIAGALPNEEAASIYSFDKQLWSTSRMPGKVIGAGNAQLKEMNRHAEEFTVLGG